MAIRAMRRKSRNRMQTKFIEVSCKVFSPFFSLKQNKVNSKNWGKTNFEVSKNQKDVWDVFFKIKKKDDGDWNLHNFTLHELHAFIKYTSSSNETRSAVF